MRKFFILLNVARVPWSKQPTNTPNFQQLFAPAGFLFHTLGDACYPAKFLAIRARPRARCGLTLSLSVISKFIGTQKSGHVQPACESLFALANRWKWRFMRQSLASPMLTPKP